jgi:hypothetical protein
MTPGYWGNEVTGELRRAVETYLYNRKMSDEEIALMRAYLRQWIDAPTWAGDETLAGLRATVDTIRTKHDLDVWLRTAMNLGIDPL